MPRHGGKHVVLVKGAEEAMRSFKMEIAEDLGFGERIGHELGEFRNLTSVEVGQIGGEMVRRIQAAGEWAIKQRYDAHESRLMPEEILPNAKYVRDVSNNGNVQPELPEMKNTKTTTGTK